MIKSKLIAIKSDLFVTLGDIWKEYKKFRGYKNPDGIQAFLWLVSEIGELAESLVEEQSDDWVRNHADKKAIKKAESWTNDEIADVLMMLTAVCAERNVDPIQCMLDKMKTKGFVYERNTDSNNDI